MLRFLAFLAALGLACARPDASPLATGAPLSVARGDAHLLITLELSGAALRVVDARRVPGPLPVLRGEAPGDWEVEARSASGAVLHSIRLQAPDEVRGEFEGPGGRIEAHRARLDRAAFAVRLPLLPGATELRVIAPGKRVAGRVAFPEAAR